MCRYISFFFNDASDNPDIRVACLYSHGRTENILGLDPAGPYTEGHYLPRGDIECRIETGRSARSEAAIRAKWPTFKAFETWARKQVSPYYANGGYDAEGYDIRGYDAKGYDVWGYDADGYNKNGYNESGYDREGYNKWGYDAEGYKKDGYNVYGYNVAGYDKDGYDRDGYNRDGHRA